PGGSYDVSHPAVFAADLGRLRRRLPGPDQPVAPPRCNRHARRRYRRSEHHGSPIPAGPFHRVASRTGAPLRLSRRAGHDTVVLWTKPRPRVKGKTFGVRASSLQLETSSRQSGTSDPEFEMSGIRPECRTSGLK